MLVLSRKVGERILIGNNIAVTVVRLASGGVRLGIEAPPDMPVVREELAQQMKQESSASQVPAKKDTAE
ncbi:MAG: carbon storage regulator [Planctomycetales bacterium]|nr:carbon storage regulator [Planctomycetales bacterium]